MRAESQRKHGRACSSPGSGSGSSGGGPEGRERALVRAEFSSKKRKHSTCGGSLFAKYPNITEGLANRFARRMATEVQEQSLDASCTDPAEEGDPSNGIVAKHQDLDRGEPKANGECSRAGAKHSEMPAQPTDQGEAASLQGKQEEEPKPEASLVPPLAEVAVPVAVPPLGEGKGAKRMMEDDVDADNYKEMPDVCQEAREPGRAMLLPDLFGDAEHAHGSLDVGRAGGCAKVEQAVPCLSNMGSENQRKRFRGFAYKETEGPQVAYERLQELLFQWLKPEARSKEEIVEQLVLEQFLNLLPEDVQRWVRERHPENGDEAVALAEDYQFLHPEPGRRPFPERARQRASARSWLR